MVYAHIYTKKQQQMFNYYYFFSKFVLIKLYNKYLNIPRKIEFVFKLFYILFRCRFSVFQLSFAWEWKVIFHIL